MQVYQDLLSVRRTMVITVMGLAMARHLQTAADQGSFLWLRELDW